MVGREGVVETGCHTVWNEPQTSINTHFIHSELPLTARYIFIWCNNTKKKILKGPTLGNIAHPIKLVRQSYTFSFRVNESQSPLKKRTAENLQAFTGTEWRWGKNIPWRIWTQAVGTPPPQMRQIYLFFLYFFNFFKGHTHGIWKFPGSGLNRSCSLQPTPQSVTAVPGLSHICDLHNSLRQCHILNPLSEARDQTDLHGYESGSLPLSQEGNSEVDLNRT